MILGSVGTAAARLRRWVLLDGDRLVVTAVLLVGIYVVLDPLGHWLPELTGLHFGSGHRETELLNALLGGIFLLVSIVVTIASLYVTQEQGALRQQFERVEATVELRRDIEEATDVSVTPTAPGEYLFVLVDAISAKADELREVAENDDENVEKFLHEMATQTEELRDEIRADHSIRSLVLATMGYDNVLLINQLRQFRAEHGGDLPDDAEPIAEELSDLLQHFAATREYFKTLYFSREFAALTKHLIYVSLPTILLVAFVLLHSSDFPDTHTSIAVVSTLALAPFALLSAYVLRVATVASRTRSSGRFHVGHEEPDRVLELDRPSE